MPAPSKTSPEIKSVSATPEKNFFVNMLTRDIELQDAILDLLDNCVDGATRTLASQKKSDDSLEGFWAKITLSKKRFVLEDNCGGIPWEIARTYAFNLGKPPEAQKAEGTIGIVGIGMKRAIFKMGRSCHVHSHHEDDSFMVSIKPKWFDSPKWDDFEAEREASKAKDHGTIVEIEELTEDTTVAFAAGSTFIKRLERTIGESYAYLIEKGFKIFLVHAEDSRARNVPPIKGQLLELCFEEKQKSDLIRPFMFQAEYGGVDIFFAVGYRSGIESEEELDEDRESSYSAGTAGWTIICNDRVVLSNDRTIKTGWESGGVPRFHNQFSCIAGVVEFSSRDTKTLPITTTKRGVDMGKDVYLFTLGKMQEATRYFTKNTNTWKGHEREIKARFDGSPRFTLTDLKRKATAIFAKTHARNGAKQYKPDLPVKRKTVTTRRITFTRAISEIEKVSEYLTGQTLEETSANEVGEACFVKALKEAGS